MATAVARADAVSFEVSLVTDSADEYTHARADITWKLARYALEWSRTLNARGRAMAKKDGWWNQALRKWGTSADAIVHGKREVGDMASTATSLSCGVCIEK